MMGLDHYVQWRWLLFFGWVFWIALVVTDEFYQKYLNQKLVEYSYNSFDDLELNKKPIVDEPIIIEQPKIDEILLENANNPVINTKNFWNAFFILASLGILVFIKLRPDGLSGLLPQISPKDMITISTLPQNEDCMVRDEIYVSEDFLDTIEDLNKIQRYRPSPATSRPPSRCMKSPSVDVRAVQEKLETLQKTVAAMRDRHSIPPGIVSQNKDFQKFLTGLKTD